MEKRKKTYNVGNEFFKVLKEPKQLDFYTTPLNEVCCHHCCETFSGIPIGLPQKFNDLKKKMKLSGIYCSFECALGGNREINDQRTLFRKSELLYYRKMLFGIDMSKGLKEAPPRTFLKKFGGALDIDEFRDYSRDYVLEKSPVLYIIPYEESILEKLKHHKVVPAIKKKAPPLKKKKGLILSTQVTQSRLTYKMKGVKSEKNEQEKRKARLKRLGINVE
jgi:hypothetical protein